MIKTFENNARDFVQTGKSGKIDAKMNKLIFIRLDRLDAASKPQDMNLPGFEVHGLKRLTLTRYPVHANEPWRTTFDFENGDAYRVDFEQYH